MLIKLRIFNWAIRIRWVPEHINKHWMMRGIIIEFGKMR